MFALRTPRRVTQTVVGAGLAVFLTVVACSHSDGTPTTTAGGTVDLRSDRLTGDQAWQSVVPVCWTGNGDQAQRLFREPVRVRTSATADPIESSVMAMTQAQPADTDYGSMWSPITSLGTSFSRGVITLDLPSTAVSQSLDADRAELAVQQMVHTAVAAAQSSGLVTGGDLPQVRILVDGESGQEVFGSYSLPDKLSADPAALAGVSLEPERLQVEPGVLTVSGRVTDPVHDVELTVESLDGEAKVLQRMAVNQDYSRAETAMSGVEVTRTVTLEAGTYRVSITATDADGKALSDDFVVTVAEPE